MASLLILNTGLLAAVVFFSLSPTAGVAEPGLLALVPAVNDTRWTYLVGSLLFTESILAFALFGVKAAYALIVVFCFETAMLAPLPSPVDECSHLAFIRYVSQHGRIPSTYEPTTGDERAIRWGTYPSPVSDSALQKRFPTKRHHHRLILEAFQPPLYYWVMALPFPFLPDNLVHKLYGLRLLGTVMLLVTAVFLKRTLAFISDLQGGEGSQSFRNFLQFGVVCLICLNPGTVHRMTILGYAQTGIMVASVLGYWLARMIMRDSAKTYEVVVLGVLSGMLALSNYYSIVFFPIIGLWLLWCRNLKQVLLYVAIVCFLTGPWLLHNYFTYGTVNAAEVAKNQGLQYGLGLGPYGMSEAWAMLMANVPRAFLAQESYILTAILPGVEKLSECLAFGSLLAVAVCAADMVLRSRKSDRQRSARFTLISIAASVVLGTVGLLLVVSCHSQLGLVIRYGYLALPSLGVLVYAAVSMAPRTLQALAASFMVFVVAVSSVNGAAINVQYTNLIPRSMGQTYRTCWLEIEPDENPNMAPISTAGFSQSFRADYDRLCGISVFICPCSTNTGERFTFRLSGERGQILHETEFGLSEIKECSYRDIVFDPIPSSRGRIFSFTVSASDLSSDRFALLPLSKPGAYQFGSAHTNGDPIKEHAVFDTIFRYDFWSTAVPTANNESPSVPPRIAKDGPSSRLCLKPQANENVGPIFSKGIQQWFTADSDNLCGIRVLINTYLRWPVSPYRFQLLDEYGAVIREMRLPGDKMHDWHFFPACFEPIPDSAGKHFAFAIIPDAPVVEAPITLPLAAPGPYPGGHALINGTPTTRSVVFKTVFKYQLHEEFQRAWRREGCQRKKATERP